MKDDTLDLIHIEESIERIEQYIVGGHDDFRQSTMIQDSVLRNLQILAELIQRLSDKIKHENPGMEWRKIAGFRNILVHNYLGVDIDRVWEILIKDFPP